MNYKTQAWLLTSASCAGVIATMIFTRQSSIKADAVRRKEKLITKKDIVKKTGKYYVPALACGGATIATILMNQHLTNKHITGIVAAAGASSRLYHEFERKSRDIFGDLKVDEVHRAIAKDHEDGIVQAATPDISAPGLLSRITDPIVQGNLLFYDEFTDIWFRSSFAGVKNAEYHLNRNFVLGGEASLKTFYEFLGVGLPPKYADLTWDDILLNDGIYWVDFNHLDAYSKEKNEHYIILQYEWSPGFVNLDGSYEMFVRR